MAKRPTAPYLAVLTWHDAYGKDGQIYSETPTDHAPLVVETVGWISRADDIGVTLYGERIANGDGTVSWREHGFIPKGMVVEITPVAAKKPRKPPVPSKHEVPPIPPANATSPAAG